MTSGQRATKRIIVIIVYILIFFLIGELLYFSFRTKPTCSDKIRNQGEEGVDCGGPCQACETIPELQDVQVLERLIIPSGQNKYDALVKVKNPNALYGVANFDYSLDFVSSTGSIVAQVAGSSFLLPAQTKYLFAFNINLAQAQSAKLQFRTKTLDWKKFTSYEEPDIAVYQKEFNFVSGGSGFAELKAKIQNRTNYDFHKISTGVIIRDKAGRPVAVNETNNNDVKSNEEREVTFQWGYPFTQNIDPQNIEIVPEANVFDDANYMKSFGSSDQYKTYHTDIIK